MTKIETSQVPVAESSDLSDRENDSTKRSCCEDRTNQFGVTRIQCFWSDC